MQDGSAGNREKLQRFVQRLSGRTKESFLAEFKVPILVQMTEPGASAQDLAPKFGTMSLNKEALIFAETGLYAFPLRKSTTNAFAMMITVGRASNNDIVLPYDGISKFHAYFSSTPAGWVLVDAKSTNGTFVNERRLAPDAKEKLELGKNPLELSFSAAIKCRLYTPDAFFDMATEVLNVLQKRPR